MRTEEHQKQRKGAIAVMETLISLAPKIRAPIQLAGFLFSTLAVALIQFINPSDKQAMIVAGLLGVVLVALALLFHPTMIKLFPVTQRAPLVLLTLLLIFSSFGALAYVTVASTYSPRPSGARFDTFLEQKNVRLIRSELGQQKVELTWNFVPLSNRPKNGATIFTGLVVLHDEIKITKDGAGVITQSTCAEVPSCINSHYFRQMEINPLLVRSDSRGTEHTVVLDLKVA